MMILNTVCNALLAPTWYLSRLFNWLSLGYIVVALKDVGKLINFFFPTRHLK